MYDVITKVNSFLKLHITPSISFNLVYLKARFFSMCISNDDMGARFQRMVIADLFPMLAEVDASSPGQSKGEHWLRALLIGYTCELIINMAAVDVEDRRVSVGTMFSTIEKL